MKLKNKFLIMMTVLVNTSFSFAVLSVGQTAFASHNQIHAAQQCMDRGGEWTNGRCTTEICGRSFLGLPTWYKYLELDGNCEITGPKITGTDELIWPRVIGYVGVAVLEILLRLATLASIGFVMYGGFRYITSQGEPDATKSARQTIQNALIGMVISLISTAIVAFIANELTN